MSAAYLCGDTRGAAQTTPTLEVITLTGTTARALSATPRVVQYARLIGAKALSDAALPTANASPVRFGFVSGASWVQRGVVPVYASATDPGVNLGGATGRSFDLAQVMVQAETSGDQVVLETWE